MAEQILFPFPDPPPEGTATEVASGILWLRLPLPMALDHVNVYALEEDDGWTLVDGGFHSGRSAALWERLLAGPLGGRPVRRFIGTHHHPDHIGMAGWFQARGAELVMTRTAWLTARMLTLDMQDRPTPESLRFWREAGLPPERLAARAAERPFNFADCVHPLPAGFTRIREGDRMRIGGRDWQIRIGHGHAPAHATFWSEEIVLGGDQLLPGISANIGVYPTEPEADPLAEWLESCARLAQHARPGQLVLPGHKLPFTGLPFRLAQMASNHHAALERLRAWIATPRSAHGCFPALFRREIGPAEEGLALVEAVAHLNHLMRRGEARRHMGPEGAWLWQAAQDGGAAEQFLRGP
ncbi:MBL fold metallo-hydrolase [Pseudogemmobacter sonorensis]|uniref:MBL fold metallo-hydrolase n=1 Tax=Pseudogemmobacter sonorensis TaxID=2989681 RepID=UPI0036A230E3